MDRQKEKRKRGVIVTCDTAGRLRRRTLFELGGIPERKLDRSAQEWELGGMTSSPIPLGHIDFIKSTITGASQADATLIMVPAVGKFTTANARGHYKGDPRTDGSIRDPAIFLKRRRSTTA